MNFFQRAMCSVTRRKSKSLILFLIVFVLGNIIAGSVAIYQASMNVEAYTKERLGSIATLEIDMESMMQAGIFQDIEPISESLADEIGQHESVASYDYSYSTNLTSDSLDTYTIEADAEEGGFVAGRGINDAFILEGSLLGETVDFQEGNKTLEDGRFPTQEELDAGSAVAMISQQVADLNDIVVGDIITLTNEVYEPQTFDMEAGRAAGMQNTTQDLQLLDSHDVTLEVIGIYENTSSSTSENGTASIEDYIASMSLNTILTTNGVVKAELDFTNDVSLEFDDTYIARTTGVTPTYLLKSADELDAFQADIEPLVPENYKLVLSTDAYDSVASPILSLKSMSVMVLWVACIAAILILSLFIILSLRDRKREFGIYMAIGERTWKIIAQVFVEICVVAIVALVLSVFTGNMLSKNVADTLIQNEVTTQENVVQGPQRGGMSFNNASLTISTDEIIDAYEIELDSMYVVTFLTISMTTIVVATIIPMGQVLKLKPKEVLLER
ncbi:FtsX-like permease family protein [Fundicoccus culcitae]|uniref:ABC transporter permease n=1 Tax=Fundicoccus culcitae TaxID=2969821 RepID=A0ABY5P401_9LACT|nr:ABC transporter permease [Fundicoccus culcitae]UUX33135.1 ABC transporter permease [Fundicoccus culcitae]